jgi:triosephosphate isomerase
VSDAVKQIKQFDKSVLVFVGAGVSNARDVSLSVKLGAEGVLLASAFVKAKSPKALLQSMVDAI